MKATINKLYAFIAKLVVLLEDELNELETSRSKNVPGVKKNIADTLNKLVVLITQLNKLSKEIADDKPEISKEDQDIIKRFVEKYNARNESKG